MKTSQLIDFGRVIRKVLAGVPSTQPVTTAHLAGSYHMDFPDWERQSIFNALSALAKAGFPGAVRGPEKVQRLYGRSVTKRPWLWHDAGQEAVETWAGGLVEAAPKAPTVLNLLARLEELTLRVEALEARK